MPAKFLIISKKADKQIKKLPLSIQNKIDTMFDLVKTNPLLGYKLHGELEGLYKVRMGDYRLIYTFDKKLSCVQVLKIEHRQGVYK